MLFVYDINTICHTTLDKSIIKGKICGSGSVYSHDHVPDMSSISIGSGNDPLFSDFICMALSRYVYLPPSPQLSPYMYVPT